MKVLVTGGGGFLGRAVVRALLAEGHAVRSASRGSHPELERLGAESVVCDVGDARAVSAAVAGTDAVVHVAALAGVWGPRAEYVRTNVLGTRHVLAACRAHGVRKLVYTSSPSVCFDGADHVDASNDLPYAARFLSPYPETKAIAEREVLAANGPELATCALRPHLIVGPGDPHLLPRLVARARAGKLAAVGDGTNRVSITHVDNAARAHVDALARLEPGAACAGRAYFVAQREPVELWPWLARVLESHGVAPPTRRVSLRTAYAAGAVLELAWRALRLAGEPPMTRFVALQLATTHTYDLAPLERDVGYQERVSLEEATESLRPGRTRAAVRAR